MDEVRDIEQTEDLVERALKLAALVTRIFGDEGWDLVVVGGSAVEFYTEGAYMSGDIDLCRRNVAPIPLRKAQDLMGRLGAKGGPRSWQVAGLYVDLLGLLENEAKTPFRDIETPLGKVVVVPAELVLIERVLLGFYPDQDDEAKDVARKMMAVCLTGKTPVDWAEVERLAGIPAFGIVDELSQLRGEVADELNAGD
ncbi:MAG: hypothetical protein O2923_05095 [Verrucomicrobia bacterium]|nr:hypothetical protein [Verrucomicrobiota bacterium]MDA1087090.1 hypothetical protein [Verrucomicrobiota bacterium]